MGPLLHIKLLKFLFGSGQVVVCGGFVIKKL